MTIEFKLNPITKNTEVYNHPTLPNGTEIMQDGMTSTRAIAEVFGKAHKNVLSKVRNSEVSEEFARLNFKPSSYTGADGSKTPQYLLTREGFFLTAMGFTGSAAAQWREAFIKAFNEYEQVAITAMKNVMEYRIQSLKSLHAVSNNFKEARIDTLTVSEEELIHHKAVTDYEIAYLSDLVFSQQQAALINSNSQAATTAKKAYTVSDLGSSVDVSGAAMNKHLVKEGLQVKVAYVKGTETAHYYQVTPKGSDYAIDVAGDDSKAPTLRWLAKVLADYPI
ncbi:Rha family transcriptional regulator [Vibrio splendidus]|uniref:Rha family transcriptional regulator n=1 Tax=Vibrio splendidus TaxID=29497 RepID=UPI000D385B41|nr:Rha family transcriptional regulator [Vibrio splendidus]PTP95464.1 hypothetical protein CWO02_01075 [Vibrio splendidus]